MSTEIRFAPEVSAAIPEVMKGVKRLPKADKNTYDNYVFTSIDAYLEFMNPLLADAGLSVAIEEDEPEFYVNKKDSLWMRGKFRIWLVHSSGASSGPFTRRVAVPMTGAQSYGSAQSYALKQFLRAQFMVPTGEKDEADTKAADPHQAAPVTKPAATKTEATGKPVKTVEDFLAEIEATPDDGLGKLKRDTSAARQLLGGQDQQRIVEAYQARAAAIKARQARPLKEQLEEALTAAVMAGDAGLVEAVVDEYKDRLLEESIKDPDLYDNELQPLIDGAREATAEGKA